MWEKTSQFILHTQYYVLCIESKNKYHLKCNEDHISCLPPCNISSNCKLREYAWQIIFAMLCTKTYLSCYFIVIWRYLQESLPMPTFIFSFHCQVVFDECLVFENFMELVSTLSEQNPFFFSIVFLLHFFIVIE